MTTVLWERMKADAKERILNDKELYPHTTNQVIEELKKHYYISHISFGAAINLAVTLDVPLTSLWYSFDHREV